MLANELIERVFAVGDFDEQDGARLALVTRNRAWQECVARVLWRELDIKICSGAPPGVKAAGRGKKAEPDQVLFIHKQKTQKKLRRLEKKLGIYAPLVKVIRIDVARGCHQAQCRYRHALPPLLQACSALDTIEVNAGVGHFDSVVAPLIQVLRKATPTLRKFHLYALEERDGRPIEPSHTIVRPLRESIDREVLRHPAFARGWPPATGKDTLALPSLVLSCRENGGWGVPRTITNVLKLDYKAATSLTLHGTLAEYIELKSFNHLVALDITLKPSLNGLRGFAKDILVPALRQLFSLRKFTVRVDTPDPELFKEISQTYWADLTYSRSELSQLGQSLICSLLPSLQVLKIIPHSSEYAAKSESKEDTEEMLRSAANFAYELVWGHGFGSLEQALQKTFFDLQELSLPGATTEVKRALIQDTVRHSPTLRQWLQTPSETTRTLPCLIAGDLLIKKGPGLALIVDAL